MTAAITARGLAKSYSLDDQPVTAIAGIDLDVAAGEFVAVMGPSGCGKSTLLHLLGGLTRPTAGALDVAGNDMVALSDDGLAAVRRTTIGFVFQNFNLVPVLTLQENVALPARIAAKTKKDAGALAAQALEAVGLADKSTRLPAQVSGGEQQRAAIARALVLNPAVLLADEPTGNLDSKTSKLLVDLLGELHSQGQTIVLVTHDPKAASYAKRVLFLRDGRIVRQTNLDRPGDTQLLARLIDGGP